MGVPKGRNTISFKGLAIISPTKEETDPGRDSYSPKTFHPPQAFSGRSVIQTQVSSLRLRIS